ncbi:urease accessory protein UreD [Candidatus Poribacteria bacterium]|nr:urease accessory protein UreD [Candidatus Poribacteria bacterium]
MSRIDSSAGRHGELRLAFAQQNDRTVMAESFFRVPLQVMKPRYDASGCACVYLLSPTGGIVQGDDYQIQVKLAANTHATLTTQASTKVYAMPGQGATQSMWGRVGQDAIFEYLPDSTILFRDANFSQSLSLFLERGAKVALQEIVMPGRLARGEKLAFTRYQSRIEVSDSQGLLLYDSCRLQRKCLLYLSVPGVLGEYACWGSWYLVGDFEMPWWETLCDFAEPFLNQPPDSIGGLSQLQRGGVGIRMLAHNAETIQSAFQTVWNWLKTEHLGLETVDLRKY